MTPIERGGRIVEARSDPWGAVYGAQLLPQHAKLLRASQISAAVAQTRGYRSVETKADLERKGFGKAQRNVPGLLIPIWNVSGECATYQFRPDEPRIRDGKSIKYETPSGSRMVADVPPPIRDKLGDPKVPLLITEGARKADAAVSQGLCCIDLLGVWSWRGTNDAGGLTALADWESIHLKGRTVYVVFDSDVMLKRGVHQALARLKAFLESRGAEGLIIYLPFGNHGEKVGLDDYLAAGRSVDELLAMATADLRPPPASVEPGQAGAETGDGGQEGAAARPVIQVTNRFMRDIAVDAVQCLQQANSPAPYIFRRGSELARLGIGDSGPTAEALTVVSLKGILDRAADFVSATKDGDKPARPPQDVVADILALPESMAPVPPLQSIAGAPVFVPGGRLLSDDGYDVQTGIYLHLRGLGPRDTMPLDEALDVLNELLGDFPFVDDASLAHAFALLLQPFVRPLIAGPCPLYLINAPSRGTGKGLLASMAAVVALGEPAHVMVLTANEEEIDKRLTSILLAGHPLVLIDNVTALRSSSLAAALTATGWQGRLLGKSRMVRVRNDATWVATGNNPALSDEITRRTVEIRLDAGVECPEERTGFLHPQLLAWATKRRTRLVGACLSIIGVWVDAGMPLGGGVLGGFEPWAGPMSGILDAAGVPGFLGNRDQLRHRVDREMVRPVRRLVGAIC